MRNLLNIKEIQVKDKLYEFRLTYKAKVEIDHESRKGLQALGDENIAKALPFIHKLNDETISEQERMEAFAKVSPLLQSEKLDTFGEIEPVHLGYILLHNLKGNESMSKEEYYNTILPTIEEELGFEKMMQEFNEIHSKVFMMLEKLNVSPKK